jgi:hypothetical protein
MYISRRIAWAGIALVCVCLCALLCFLFLRHPSQGSPHERREAAEEQKWRDAIRAHGAREAYEELAVSIASLPETEQHTRAHTFGAALYDEVGLAGVSVCDDRFEQGCMHAFIGLAVADNGLAVIEKLQAQCTEALAPYTYYCEHGIGHGLMTYFGVTDTGLRQSLAYCTRHEDADPLNGCDTGVFMEYFERNVTMGYDLPRPVENGNIFSVCSELSGTPQWLCYYWLPHWWHQLDKHQGIDEPQIFTHITALCSKVPSEWHDVCISGIGHIVPSTTNYNIAQTIERCDAIAKDIGELARCRAQSANDFLLLHGLEEALQVCVGLEGSAREFCDALARTPSQKSVTIRP